MAPRVKVMRGVPAVVEAESVAGDVDEGDTRAEIGFRVDFIDESVLAEVADH